MRSLFVGILVILTLFSAKSFSQYAPQYPLPGNDAIAADDPRIVAWATTAELNRGWMNIADTTLGKVSTGIAAHALGPAGTTVVSLGDGGSITLGFDVAISNGEGPDFAVFENAFPDPLDSTLAFLEFAFVEVSSDGEHFVRFPARSSVPIDTQRNTTSYIEASLVHNLAGKYLSGYGTPFDLEELVDSPGIDLNDIRYVRIVDVVGSIDPKYASYDADGFIINDPYPTPFPQGGFDLDAVAVLNSKSLSIPEQTLQARVLIYPNPCAGFFFIQIPEFSNDLQWQLFDLLGNLVQQDNIHSPTQKVDVRHLLPGMYFLKVEQQIFRIILA